MRQQSDMTAILKIISVKKPMHGLQHGVKRGLIGLLQGVTKLITQLLQMEKITFFHLNR